MNKQKISIIIPVYKVEKYLSKCLDSIINQTYKNLEIILIDDGSPDECPKICDDYAKKDDRIKVLHLKNGGVSNARNKGLEVASGDFVTFVDSDDHICETMYEKLLSKQQETDADLVFARFKYEDEITGEIINVNETSMKDFCETRDIVYFYNHTTNNTKVGDNIVINNNVMCNIWRCLFKKTAISNVRFTKGITFMEDVVFLSDILKNKDKKLAFVDEYLYYYLIRSTSAVRNRAKNVVENSKNYLAAMHKILKGSDFEKYLPALEYFCYGECVLAKYTQNINLDLKEVKSWASKKNFIENKKITYGKKQKIKYFLIRNKLFLALRIIYKLK